jgi:Na+:H+ antiporter, NhaA family
MASVEPSRMAERERRSEGLVTRERPKSSLFGAVVRPLQAFLHLEASSGILLLLSAVAALTWANLDPASYAAVFSFPLTVGTGDAIVHFTIAELINDGLMTVFFFVVGMEIKRELAAGELDSVPKAALPAVAAVGGMVVPAGLFLICTRGTPAQVGWGIPMATDIAFCVGVLTLLGKHVPRSLVVFVTALAIFDDIGGILVIALFYGHGIDAPWLLGAGALSLLLLLMNRQCVKNGLAYATVGAALWYALHHSGIHATISGVVAGLMIPARPQRPCRDVIRELGAHVRDVEQRSSDEELRGAEILMIEEKLEELEAPLNRFVHLWHPFVAFLVMPTFALANSGVSLHGAGLSTLAAPVALGTTLGLVIGKQLGIFGFTVLAVRLGLAPMPDNASSRKLYGVSVVAGIGFTVALFIAALAYGDAPEYLAEAKVGILFGSLVAGVIGFVVLRLPVASRLSPPITSDTTEPAG